MAGITKRVSLGLAVALIGAMIASTLVPNVTRADTNLVIGQQAVISYANGDQVRLRQTPEYEGTLIALYDEGRAVMVLDGPVTDEAGNYWYQVSIDEQIGYMVADFLALENGIPLEVIAETTEEPVIEPEPVLDPIVEVPMETDPVAVIPEAPLAGEVLAIGWIAGANGDGVRCRAAADLNAPVVTILPEGTQVEITGPVTDIWQPINCMGGGGFVAAEFVSLIDPSVPQVLAPATDEIQTPPVADDGATPVDTPATEDVADATETAVTDDAVAETTPEASTNLETETPDENAIPEADAPAVIDDAPGQTEADEVMVLDADLISGFAIVTGTNGDGVRCRARASSTANTIVVLMEGTSVELTGAPTGVWQPVYCNGVAGFVSNLYLGAGETTSATTDNVTSFGVGAEVSAASLAGSALVSGTNGDGLRCRSDASYSGSVITVLGEGSSVSLRGLATGDWQPVVCAGVNGWVFAGYLGNSSNSAGNGSTSTNSVSSSAVTTGSATVDSGPGGLNCRTGGSMSASVITVLSHGSTVSLRGAVSNGWQPVTCAGQAGFVASEYLSSGSTSGAPNSNSSNTSSSSASTGSAIVNSAPGGLNCRTGGSMSASVITVLSHGSTVSLRGAVSNGWQPVTCAGQAGFVASEYLGSGNPSSSSSSSTSSSSSSSSGAFASGTTLYVSGTGGGGVRVRSSAGYDGGILAVAPEGASVTTRNGSSGEWVAVTYGGSNGFIYGDYLAKNSSSSASTSGNGNTSNNSNTSAASGMGDGDRASTDASLNLRYSASFSAGVAAVAPEGTVVLITGSATNGFYPVDWDGLKGFMSADYLTKTSAAVSKRGGSASNSGTSSAPSGTTTGGAVGNSIVNYAMRYLGYPYVWATHGPSSFDCSGFTYWVTLNVLGRDIGAGLWTQVSAGAAVSRGNLQPGDLVFFQNTYTAGLSHVGIYIGNDQFIHAENETTGVRISDLNSQYYASRWYGATRLG